MIPQDHPFLFALVVIFGLCFLVQVFYYLYFYIAPSLYKHPGHPVSEDPVSVIICARNEEENLRNFLPAVLEQDYPDFEVIVVNDCSEDESYNVLGDLLKKYSNLKVSNITKDPKFTHNKKFAQFIGIKAAKNEILVFTDADCRPDSNQWIRLVSSRFDQKHDFVLGYGGFIRGKGLLNRYIRYDCVTIAMQYLGMAIRAVPYMGVGRNLAYRRSLFFDKKGFGSHSHLASGDDDLFINANASSSNTTVEFRKESHTRSLPAADIISFFKQKRRHLTTANYYRLMHKILLMAEPASRASFYALFIILLAKLYLWPVVLTLFGARLIIQYTILALTCNRLNEKGLLPWLTLFDIISPFINSIIYFGSLRQGAGKNRWN